MLFGIECDNSKKYESTDFKKNRCKDCLEVVTVAEICIDSVSNADEDFDAAIMKCDCRFVGVRGFAITYPGLPKREELDLVNKYGYKIVAGTGDNQPDMQSWDFQIFAMRYAKKYNTLMLDHVEKNKRK